MGLVWLKFAVAPLSSKVKLVCSFFGRILDLKKSLRLCLTFNSALKSTTYQLTFILKTPQLTLFCLEEEKMLTLKMCKTVKRVRVRTSFTSLQCNALSPLIIRFLRLIYVWEALLGRYISVLRLGLLKQHENCESQIENQIVIWLWKNNITSY